MILVSGSTGCRVKGAWSCNGLAGRHTCGKQPDSAVLLALPWVPAPYKMGLKYMPVMLVLASSFLLFVFWDRVSLYGTGYSGTQSVDQAGLQIRYSANSASWVLGLKSCTITAQLKIIFISGQPGMHKTLSQKTTNKHSRQGFCHTSCNNNTCIKMYF